VTDQYFDVPHIYTAARSSNSHIIYYRQQKTRSAICSSPPSSIFLFSTFYLLYRTWLLL